MEADKTAELIAPCLEIIVTMFRQHPGQSILRYLGSQGITQAMTTLTMTEPKTMSPPGQFDLKD